MDLLFICATWQGLAKLRLHTDETLKIFDTVTASLGEAMRQFSTDTCASFKTRELPKEAAARARRTTSKKAPKKSNPDPTVPVSDILPKAALSGPSKGTRNAAEAIAPTAAGSTPSSPVSAAPAIVGPKSLAPSTRRLKTLNLETYKFHSLGDVSATIRKYGTTDSYSTEVVSLVATLLSLQLLISYPG